MHTKLRAAAIALLLFVSSTPEAAETPGNRYVPADKLPWSREAPNLPVMLAPLWGDRAQGEAGTLLKVPGGFDSGLHSHTADYWAVVIEGTWRHWVPATGEGKEFELKPGAHWTQVKTQPHQDACISRTPCVIFLFNKDPYVTNFPGAQPAANVPTRSLSRPFPEMQWRKQAPELPTLITDLWGDRERDGGFGQLVQMPPGFDSGLHAHSGDFHGVLLSGAWVHINDAGKGESTRLGPGSYVRQAGGGMHVDRCVSQEPCTLFLFQFSRADVIWPARKDSPP